MKSGDRGIRVRLRICLIFFLLGFTLLTARVWQLQLLSDYRLANLEERQTDQQITLSPQRGSIYDAREREIAVSLKSPSVFADPSTVKVSKKELNRLASVLQLSRPELVRKLKNKNRKFVWLKRQIDPALEARVKALDIEGVHITREWSRMYPERELAAQVVGAVGMDGDGLEGIERYYNDFLKSQPVVIRAQKDAKGRSIFEGGAMLTEPEQGPSLYLTIDLTIQHMVEEELFRAAAKSGSKSAMAVIMDPSDGKILSMASYPSVNPNRLDRGQNNGWRNRPVEEVFEPGSTFKVFTLAAALDARAISPSQSFFCRKGSLTVSGKVIRNTHDHDWLNPEGILKFSNNIGVARIGLQLGRNRLGEAIAGLGFGEKTGIDFPGEARGLLVSADRWKPVELANISFGQGIGVTAVQLTAALSAVANGGKTVRPHILDRALLANGHHVELTPSHESVQVISKETVKLIHKWMEAVTEKGGTGELAAIPEYRTAGKTGTAQAVDPLTGKYSNDLVISSFMGFAPVSNPRLAAIFIFREPRLADYGGTLAGPIFREVMSSALRYLGVPPDQNTKKKLEPSPAPAPKLFVAEKNEPVRQESGMVPDFRGLTIREVLSRAHELSLPITIVGSGVAIRQEQKSKLLKVYFAQANSERRT